MTIVLVNFTSLYRCNTRWIVGMIWEITNSATVIESEVFASACHFEFSPFLVKPLSVDTVACVNSLPVKRYLVLVYHIGCDRQPGFESYPSLYRVWTNPSCTVFHSFRLACSIYKGRHGRGVFVGIPSRIVVQFPVISIFDADKAI